MKTKSIYFIDMRELNNRLAEALKKIPEFKTPEWAFFVKSSVARERPPFDNDFWYKRAASILRQIYIRRYVGVNRLRKRYGGRKNRGVKPARHKKGSGKIIRTIMQQAENAGLVQKIEKRGRKLSEKGRQLIESIIK
ncbi:MAG: 30S ribosomal protein S19e [Candidatus Pacearchaeota archaeon]